MLDVVGKLPEDNKAYGNELVVALAICEAAQWQMRVLERTEKFPDRILGMTETWYGDTCPNRKKHCTRLARSP